MIDTDSKSAPTQVQSPPDNWKPLSLVVAQIVARVVAKREAERAK